MYDVSESSDSSDEDYIPPDDGGPGVEGESTLSGKKLEKSPKVRHSSRINRGARAPAAALCSEETPPDQNRADNLWQEFLKDTDPPVKSQAKSNDSATFKSSVASGKLENRASERKNTDSKDSDVASIVEVASENHSMPGQSVAHRKRHSNEKLNEIMNKIDAKKNKMTTLEKSRMDWNNFKAKEGIEEELQQFRKGRHSFVDRQEFLKRTDVRQFEIEREIRQAALKKP